MSNPSDPKCAICLGKGTYLAGNSVWPCPCRDAAKPPASLTLLKTPPDPAPPAPQTPEASGGLLRPPTSGGFKPGADPRRAVNPSGRGRPKRSLAESIRIATENLTEQIAYMVNVSKGLGRDGKLDPTITHRDSMDAVKFLTDRGYGKAVETVQQAQLEQEANPMRELAVDELKALAKLGDG